MTTLHVRDASIHGVKVLESTADGDRRGWFARTFDAAILGEAGIDPTAFVQESHSRSVQRVLRGLHARARLSEAKLVRCAHGEIFDVVLDLRPWSPTFLRWESFVLDDRALRQVYIPPGCGHGHQTISEVSDVLYRMDAPYEPGVDLTVAFDDAELAIPWPLEDPIVSDRDRAGPPLAAVRPRLAEYFGATAPG